MFIIKALVKLRAFRRWTGTTTMQFRAKRA
jgi:hypothetical protein